MTTNPKYFAKMKANCKKPKYRKARIRCHRNHLAMRENPSKVNYINYEGRLSVKKQCRRLKKVKECKTMCSSFFKFYAEPKKTTCESVKK